MAKRFTEEQIEKILKEAEELGNTREFDFALYDAFLV
jgi:hypothetical protein